MPEKTPDLPEPDELIGEVEASLARIPLSPVVDPSPERLQIIWERIEHDIELETLKTEEPKPTLRIADPLND